MPGDGEPVPAGPGDVAVVRGTAPHTVADDPRTPPQYLITRVEYCAPADGGPVDIVLAPRTCGPRPDLRSSAGGAVQLAAMRSRPFEASSLAGTDGSGPVGTSNWAMVACSGSRSGSPPGW